MRSRFRLHTRTSLFVLTILAVSVGACPACNGGVASDATLRATSGTPPGQQGSRSAAATALVRFRVPSDTDLHDSTLRAAVIRGRSILLATRDSLPHNVGNALRCASCHLGAGIQPNAMPWVGVYAKYPIHDARSGKVELIEDRINDCFQRSMNGRALEPNGQDMRDIVAYLAFLSRGVPIGSSVVGQSFARLAPLRGDSSRGAITFASTCSRCHGAHGQGASTNGSTIGAPPLWGNGSSNDGAGMASVLVAASFIRPLMPYDRPGTLTAQQAFDVATYMNSQPRPHFAAKKYDWGGNAADHRY